VAGERSSGPGPSSRLSKRDILRAAARHYVHDQTLAEIAKEFGLSASYLGRVMRTAKERGWIQVRLAADHEAELEAQLLTRFPQLKRVTVIPTQRTKEEGARLLGTDMATWFDGLLDADEEEPDPQIWNVAIGGGMAMTAMVDAMVPRTNRISVGPTALTPELGRMGRNTALSTSVELAWKLRATGPGDRVGLESTRRGYRYGGAVEPPETAPELREWFARLPTRPGYAELLRFWSEVDVAFVGVTMPEWGYADTRARLAKLGTTPEDLIARGAVSSVANRLLDAHGNEVPIAPGIPSYEPVVPTQLLRAVVDKHARSAGRTGFVVAEVWGDRSPAVRVPIEAGLVNALFVDERGAQTLLRDLDGDGAPSPNSSLPM
jgi:DNA-binding transcriptional regulator LsrR (DeoR family)